MSSRPVTWAFYATAVIGIVLSAVLAINEAGHQPAIEVRDVRHERVGDRIEVEARVTNTTDERRCPEIRAAARDRDARDLAEVVAEPAEGAGAIDPGATVTYRAQIEGLTEQQHTEELAEVRAYPATSDTC
jgi:hypothetical protein